MRKWAFIISILGMFILVLVLNVSPIKIETYSELEKLEVNTKVSMSGIVVSERIIYEGTKLFEMSNDIELVCECLDNLEGKQINVIGIVEEYKDKKQIRVLEII
jgi:hypothetical protein